MIDVKTMSFIEVLKEAIRIKFMDQRAYVNGSILSDDDYISFIMNKLMNEPDEEAARLQVIFDNYYRFFSREF